MYLLACQRPYADRPKYNFSNNYPQRDSHSLPLRSLLYNRRNKRQLWVQRTFPERSKSFIFSRFRLTWLECVVIFLFCLFPSLSLFPSRRPFLWLKPTATWKSLLSLYSDRWRQDWNVGWSCASFYFSTICSLPLFSRQTPVLSYLKRVAYGYPK